MQTLSLAAPLFDKIADGSKTSTIRYGKRDVQAGPLQFTASDRSKTQLVQVSEVYTKTWADLGAEEAALEGYESATALRDALRVFYPRAKDSDEMTIIRFQRR